MDKCLELLFTIGGCLGQFGIARIHHIILSFYNDCDLVFRASFSFLSFSMYFIIQLHNFLSAAKETFFVFPSQFSPTLPPCLHQCFSRLYPRISLQQLHDSGLPAMQKTLIPLNRVRACTSQKQIWCTNIIPTQKTMSQNTPIKQLSLLKLIVEIILHELGGKNAVL